MQRVCFVLQVRPERLDEYRERHRAVWAEMLLALHATGWNNYSLFLRNDGLLVGYLETADFDQSLSGMAQCEINDRWQREMAPFFADTGGATADQLMRPLKEVFNLDEQLGRL